MSTHGTRVIARGTDEQGNTYTLTESISGEGADHLYRVLNGPDAMVSPMVGSIYAGGVVMGNGKVGRWDIYQSASWTDRHIGSAYSDAERGEIVADAFESLAQTRFASLITY